MWAICNMSYTRRSRVRLESIKNWSMGQGRWDPISWLEQDDVVVEREEEEEKEGTIRGIKEKKNLCRMTWGWWKTNGRVDEKLADGRMVDRIWKRRRGRVERRITETSLQNGGWIKNKPQATASNKLHKINEREREKKKLLEKKRCEKLWHYNRATIQHSLHHSKS